MHSEPTMWLQGRRTARWIMPLGEGVVPYSSKQMEQCWSSLLRIPRPTLGRRARNLEAMVGWVRSVWDGSSKSLIGKGSKLVRW